MTEQALPHLEILVEERSAEVALRHLLPKILGERASYSIYAYGGRQDLLLKLPKRLRSYARYIQDNWFVVVLVDRDLTDCLKLKARLEDAARQADLATRSRPGREGRVQVLNRIAIEELEAWFFGDLAAIIQAFPGVPETLERRAGYRDPDAIRGGTSEALDRVLAGAGYPLEGKIDRAHRVAEHMDPDLNRSRSFQVFRDGLLSLVAPD